MIASPRKRHALDLFAGLPGAYDRMGAVMSFGQDPRWRRAMVPWIPGPVSACSTSRAARVWSPRR
jgi:ubiquinone/menaquinone biosynthesis C-methylase UbiE